MLAEKKKQALICFISAYPAVLYLLFAFAPYAKSNLIETLEATKNMVLYPIRLCPMTAAICTGGTLIYILAAIFTITSIRNYRNDEEHGSARFGSRWKLSIKYKSKNSNNEVPKWQHNILLTKHIKIGLDVYNHQKNINVLIIGGAGTWKTRGYIIPNLITGSCSFVVTDPKGEILTKVGKLLCRLFNYDVRVLDLKNHEKSFCYNPFVYFRNDNDIVSFVNQTWEAMSDKKAAKGEDVWPEQAKAMLLSFMLYLWHYAPEDEQNFKMVMKLIHEVESSEEDNNTTVLDALFDEIPHDSVCYGYYKTWSSAKGRTLASILATLNAKMTVFNLPSLQALTYCDELNLIDLCEGKKKVALFCVIPDNDTSFNFLAGTLYSQLFKITYDYADNVMHGPLKIPLYFLMDEFANVALPDDYEHILSTSRSRNIFFSIVLQNKNQIEALFEKTYQTLIGNCDEILFLGSNELETCKYISDLMDDETVIIRTYGRSWGRNGNVSRNETKAARKLMTPGEIRRMSNNKAILMIRGEDPVIDDKINLKKCRNYKYVADG